MPNTIKDTTTDTYIIGNYLRGGGNPSVINLSFVNGIIFTGNVAIISFFITIKIPKEINPTDFFLNLADNALFKAKETKNTAVKWNLDCSINSY